MDKIEPIKGDVPYRLSLMLKLNITLLLIIILFIGFDYLDDSYNNIPMFSITIPILLMMQISIVKYRNSIIAEHLLLTIGVFIPSMFLLDNQITSAISWSFLLPLLAFTVARFNTALIYSIILIISLFSISLFISHYPFPITLGVAGRISYLLALSAALFFVLMIEKRRLLAMKQSLAYQYELEGLVAKSIAEYEEAQKSLIQQSKMASMGEMLGMILHQWQQPMTTIKAISANIELQKELGNIQIQDYEDAQNGILDQHTFMLETMRDFQGYLRPDKVASTFSLKEGFEDLFKLFSIQYKNQNITLDFQENEDIKVLGYYNEYRQVILNIINNARDVYEEKNIDQKPIQVLIKKDDRFGMVCIQDFAGGVPDEIIEKIFDPYMTTKDVIRGSGIGLHMSKTIIEHNMHGVLEVKNQNGGACFTIKLPLAS